METYYWSKFKFFEVFYLSFSLFLLLRCSNSVISNPMEPPCSWVSFPSNSTFLSLECELRKLPGPESWTNDTYLRQQMEKTRQVKLKCHPQLLYESFLNPNQAPLFHLTTSHLDSLEISYCKIRKIGPHGLAHFLKILSLQTLTLESHNGDWSGSYSLEIDHTGFDGLIHLIQLNLSWNNIYTLPDFIFCSLPALRHLNLSHNRMSTLQNQFESTYNNMDESRTCSFHNLETLDLSYNTLQRVSQNGFRILPNLLELRLQNNQIEEIEIGGFGNSNGLRLLNLSSNRLVTLPPRLFPPHSSLRELRLANNSITSLSPSLFLPLESLLLLDLSQNGLSSLTVKDTLFTGLIRLIVLKISYNALTFIDSFIFVNLISLQALHLDNNRIEDIHPEAFRNLPNLHLLDLSRNRLVSIESPRIFSSLAVLRQLYLDHNKIRKIGDLIFVNTTSLKDLGLAGNSLTEIPLALQGRGLESIETLDLGENRISMVTNESFTGLRQLYGLRLVDNRLTDVSAGLCSSLKKLHVLNLAQNRIRSISLTAFSGCPKLRALRLDTNQLENFPVTLTPTLPSLLWLNVSENRLRWVDYHLLPPTIEWLDLSYNLLQHLGGLGLNSPNGIIHPIQYSLRVLDASHNNLTQLDYTTIPPTLETLRLNSNRIRFLAPDTFSRAGRLRRIELMENEFDSVPLGALRLPTVEGDRTLPEIYLSRNSFLCDCSMEWLTRLNQLSLLRQYPQIVDIDGVGCRSLNSRRSGAEIIPLPDTAPSQFLCSYRSHCFALCQCCDFDACDCAMTCPSNCTCFHDSAWSTNIVECSRLDYDLIPERIPMDSTEIYLDGNNLGDLGSHRFIGKKNLRILYLNGSRIASLRNKTFNGLRALEILHLESNLLQEILGYEFRDLESLRELHLQNNHLHKISADTFHHLHFLQVLRLDGNYLTYFEIWELNGNARLTSLTLASNLWSCSCEFLIPFRTWIDSRASGLVVDFGLTRCQPSHEKNGGIPITSVCTTAGTEEISISQNYALLNEEQVQTRILLTKEEGESSNDTGNEEVITIKRETKPTSGADLWTLILILIGLSILVITCLLIVLRRLTARASCPQLSNFSQICGTASNRDTSPTSRHEKVGDTSRSPPGIFCGDEIPSNKLFDAFVFYNRHDEELVVGKLCPELEQNPPGGRSLRLLVHYRDMTSNPWNPDIVLGGAQASKRILILLSPNFLHEELTIPLCRSTLQNLITRSTGRLVFILLPPLTESGIGSIFPELRSSKTLLNWLDPNFWPKLGILLPKSGGAYHRHSSCNDNSVYNHSMGSGSSTTTGSHYGCHFLPPAYHPIQVPASIVQHPFYPTSTLPHRQSGWAGIVPKPLDPPYFTFAENFRFHQSQQQRPTTLHYPYRPMIPSHHRPPPPPPPPHLLSPESLDSTVTGDSGHVNGSSGSSSDELEHVYSTLDSPISPSEPLCDGNNRDQSPEGRKMYFV